MRQTRQVLDIIPVIGTHGWSGAKQLNRLPLKLTDVQMMIEPASIEQRLVCALLDDLAVIDHDDLIRIADHAQAVCDRTPPSRWASPPTHRLR